ncbi:MULTISPECIES: hypothetical protein [Paraburkholderia]|uniref:Uncharacterized protein n=1 Tax=Paraburkholderia madseniana TaxID=2599607 RepID=A0AAP5BJS7_9BURK|nr:MULTISPECIES: hypothetical protein [Paraburkholderia]MCX4150019.1 hypothetical protein [Paraburkholderia madseniana]MCX4175690.1 hypothetical protein [Paraburkholderia madseniana]MDN7152955.1 hypothetical protein [Paraburkholderia sp. WS6]MDQ6411837.1 hypothetical protein [Paraburkholderia madseniana]MDQ6463685.1 hypothetical protein [Paraburkholderia madseniana]
MQSQDLVFLENALSSFIETAIHRVAHSGDMQYSYRITAAEVKEATDRQRLHEAIISEYQQFFANHHVGAAYDAGFASFSITIDLNRCVLSPAQAKFLSTAMETFRAENT